MDSKLRKPLIAGNWKMYKTIQEATDFFNAFIPGISSSENRVFLAVPFTLIKTVTELTQNTNITVGAQNMNDASEGAFTGEIAAKMLLEVGAKFVIIGHSERRHLFHESDQLIHSKIQRALSDGIQPLLCVGETLQERENHKTEEVIKNQLMSGLKGVNAEQLAHLVIAYEPIWAIGNDQTATPEVAQQVHAFIRQTLTESWGEDSAQQVSILYGGSVKPDNAFELMSQADIDGLLVGGASLSVASFEKIVNFQSTKPE